MNVIMKLNLNTREIIQSKANDEDLSSNAKNLPFGHASSKVLKGSFEVVFLDNVLKSTGSDPLKERNDESLIIDTKQGWKEMNNIQDCNNRSDNV